LAPQQAPAAPSNSPVVTSSAARTQPTPVTVQPKASEASQTTKDEQTTHVYGSAPGRTVGVVSSSSRSAPFLALILYYLL
jgi:hypothetical protein